MPMHGFVETGLLRELAHARGALHDLRDTEVLALTEGAAFRNEDGVALLKIGDSPRVR